MSHCTTAKLRCKVIEINVLKHCYPFLIHLLANIFHFAHVILKSFQVRITFGECIISIKPNWTNSILESKVKLVCFSFFVFRLSFFVFRYSFFPFSFLLFDFVICFTLLVFCFSYLFFPFRSLTFKIWPSIVF